MLRFPAALVVALLACAGTASAAPTVIPLGDYRHFASDEGYADSDATQRRVLLDGGIVIEAGDRDREGVAIVRRAPGAPPVELVRLRDRTRGGDDRWIELAVTPTRWIVAIRTVRVAVGAEDIDYYARGDLVVTGGIDGGPVRTLARCVYREVFADAVTDTNALTVAANGESVAFSGSRCPGADGTRLVAAGGTTRQIAAQGVVTGLTPRRLITTHGFVELATGAFVALKRPGNVQLVETPVAADDETIVAVTRTGTSEKRQVMRVAPDGSLLPAAGGFNRSIDWRWTVVTGGGRVATVHDGRLDAADVATGQVAYAAADDDPLLRPLSAPLAVDATRAAWTTFDCAGGPQLVIDTTVATPPPSPDRARYAPTPCRMHFAPGPLRARRGRVTVRVRCPAGCYARPVLKVEGEVVGSGSIRLAPRRTGTLRLTLNRVGRKKLRAGPIDARLVDDDEAADRPPWLPPTPPFPVRVVRASGAAPSRTATRSTPRTPPPSRP